MVTLTLTAVAVATGLAGAVATLRSTSDDATTAAVRGLMVTVSVGGAAFAAGLVVAATSSRLDGFGLVHLLYLLIVVSLPLTGVAVLLRGRRAGPGPRRLARVAGIALLAPAILGAYATHVEPFRLRVDEVPVVLDRDRAGNDEVRIAVLADLQTNGVGDHERRAIDEVLDAEPDVILLPGDLFQGDADELERELPALRAELGRLQAPGGVFFVRGDVDGGDRADRILEGSAVQILDGELAEVRVGDRTVVIGGHGLDYRAAEADQVRDELLEAAGTDAVTILLAHRPDTVLALPAGSAIDLTVAGHTHGGQVVIPGLGPPMTLSDIPRDAARGGLHEVDGNRLYVSPGVGLERGQAPQLRFLSRPAVAILTLSGEPG